MAINIADNNPRIAYTATAGQTVFTIPFEFFDDVDINLYINDTLKTITTDYTLSGGDGATGTATLTTGATVGDTIVITRDVELERTTDFPPSGPFQVNSRNTELDKIIAMIADQQDLASRGITLSDSDTSTSAELPSVTDRQGRVLAFEASSDTNPGKPIAGPLVADVTTIAAVTADIATLADIEDGTNATDAISDVAAIASNVSTVAGVSDNVTTVAGQTTNMQNITDNLSAVQNAATNATTATTKAAEAATSASEAEGFKNTAETAAESAQEAAVIASAEGDRAVGFSGLAEDFKDAAEAAQAAAETAETNAETAETNAEAAEANAENWAVKTDGIVEATDYSSKAWSVGGTGVTNTASRGAAKEWATKAEDSTVDGTEYSAKHYSAKASASASNAATSESNAATSESNAATSESNAATSESNAATSETNAATSESNAATSATTATTKATEASNSATAAAASETAAQTAQTAAETAETNAETAQTAAEAARDAAQTAETNAATSETNAATSETNAATSASTATTKATEASNSATAAAASEAAAAASAASIDPDSFLRSDADDTTTGSLTTGGDITVQGENLYVGGNSGQAKIHLKADNAGNPAIELSDTDNDNYWTVVADDSDNNLKFHGSVLSQPSGILDSPDLEIAQGGTLRNRGHLIWTAGNDGSGSGLDADRLDGLDLHTGRNDDANKVVRTDSNGYIQAGWINTTSGATTNTINRIYASYDSYVRYVTPATLKSQLGLSAQQTGSWTPDLVGTSLNLSAIYTRRYIKVGNMCTATVWVRFPSTSSSSYLKVTLPFTSANLSEAHWSGTIGYNTGPSDETILVSPNSNWFSIRQPGTGTTRRLSNYSGHEIIATVTYQIA